MSIFQGVPNYVGTNLQRWAVQATNVINSNLNGKTNNTGSITLTESSATTVVTEARGRLGPDTCIFFMPTTANAATEFGAGSIYVSSVDSVNDQFTITHANNAQTDRTFKYILVG